jgi:hypothetical protein
MPAALRSSVPRKMPAPPGVRGWLAMVERQFWVVIGAAAADRMQLRF